MKIEMRRQCGPMIALAACLLLVPDAAFAAPKCNTPNRPIAVSASNLAFGIYSPGSQSPTNSNSIVQVFCANQANDLPSFAVSLSAGGAGGFNPRKMSNGVAGLQYNMYIDTSHTIIWGDGTSGTSTQSYDGSLKVGLLSFTDYGQVPASQFVAAGVYTDLITVTVTF